MDRDIRNRLAAIGVAVAFGFGPATAFAQQAPQEQNAHPCAQDAARLCPGVAPGNGAVAACLKAHKDQLSPACKLKVLKAAEKKEEKKLEEQMQMQGQQQPPQAAPPSGMPPQGEQPPPPAK